MRKLLNTRRFAMAAGIAWPIVCLAVMKFAPGTVATPPLPTVRRGVGLTNTPPTDSTGSTQYISTGDSEQGIRIFWEIPEPGRIHGTIYIPGDQQPESIDQK